ncbi:MAG: hypothetical protein Q7S22_06705 [Candidatus Micrarchaeota archaeon]|nr:hypothetical protein [Candidatus Micrarchaeota archaeon]
MGISKRRVGTISVAVALALFAFKNPIVDNFIMAASATKPKSDISPLAIQTAVDFKAFVENEDASAGRNFIITFNTNWENPAFIDAFKKKIKDWPAIESLWKKAVDDEKAFPYDERTPTYDKLCESIDAVRNAEGSLDTLPYSKAFKDAVVAAQQNALPVGVLVPRFLTPKDIVDEIVAGDASVFTKDKLRLKDNPFDPDKFGAPSLNDETNLPKNETPRLLVIQQLYNNLADNLDSGPLPFVEKGFAKGVPEKWNSVKTKDAIIAMQEFLNTALDQNRIAFSISTDGIFTQETLKAFLLYKGARMEYLSVTPSRASESSPSETSVSKPINRRGLTAEDLGPTTPGSQLDLGTPNARKKLVPEDLLGEKPESKPGDGSIIDNSIPKKRKLTPEDLR